MDLLADLDQAMTKGMAKVGMMARPSPALTPPVSGREAALLDRIRQLEGQLAAATAAAGGCK